MSRAAIGAGHLPGKRRVAIIDGRMGKPSGITVGTEGRGNLPAGRTSFLGRDADLAELAELSEEFRLLTLAGPPGIGKSRLGLELAGRLHPDPSGRAWFVEVAALGAGGLLPVALATALGVQELPGVDLMDAIIGRLRRRGGLLVLDNCEHLARSCADLVSVLLERCPELSILATSREPLKIAGEQVWRVSPLPVPDRSQDSLLELVARSPAVSLFVERAGVAEPQFRLNAHVAGAVAEICRRLDGIPLAIELAAARADLLNPAEIAQRLDDRFRLLRGGGGSGAPRHHTLEAALDWSHALLSGAERVLLRRVSVFVGGFDLAGAEAVCEETDAGAVVHLLAGLTSKSLVALDTIPLPTVRYRLLDSVRAYAGERLEAASEAPSVRERHARYYLGLAEEGAPELVGPDQARWFERFEAERANLRSAVEWSVGHGRGEWALRMAGALVLFWRVRCRFSEGRDLLAAALSASEGADGERRATALWGLGFVELMAGNSGRAVAPLAESLALYRELGDQQGCGRALLILGNCQQFTDPPRALASLRESAELARAAGDLWCLSHALGIQGFQCALRDELVTARGLFEECLRVARGAQDQQGLRVGLLGLGSVALRQGECRLAESTLEEALAVAGELGDGYARATALQYLGELAFARGEYARARTLLSDALSLLPEGQSGLAVPALICLAAVARAEGDPPAAHRLLEVAQATFPGHRHPPILHALAELAAEEADPRAARRLFEEALDICRSGDQRSATADVLQAMGELARGEGDARRAAVLHTEALELRHQIGAVPEVVASLESLGSLAAAAGRYEQAVRTFATTEGLRAANGYLRPPWNAVRFAADRALARDALGSEDFRAALADGAAASLADAVRGFRGPRARPGSGWSSLTEAERGVADLVAEGLTNPAIAGRLFISISTVKAHLAHTFSKLGVAGRRELAREVRVHSCPVDPTGEPRG